MKRNPEFVLKELNSIPYLLPIGQAMTDFKKGIRITPVGAFLWELLGQECTEEELLSKLILEYEPEEEDIDNFKKDLHGFLEVLHKNDMLLPKREAYDLFPVEQRLSIATLDIAFQGPLEILHDNMKAFLSEAPFKDSTPDCRIGLSFHRPKEHKNGRLILRNNQLMLIDHPDCYVVLFPVYTKVYEMQINKKETSTIIFCSNQIDSQLKEELFAAMRVCFLYTALSHHMIMLHSASICYQEKAWLFSAPSGTGKSTHARLWQEAFGVQMINGDLNLIGVKDGIPGVYGTPWCGTSGIYTPQYYPLGGIFLLKRNTTDFVEELSGAQGQLSVLLRCISPAFLEDQLDTHIQLIAKIAEQIPICRLHCTPNPSAPAATKDFIDTYMSSL